MAEEGAEDARYPNLDHYLSSVFIQNFADDRSLTELSHEFASHNWDETVSGVVGDINRFLVEQQNGVDEAFDGLNPEVIPAAWKVTTAEWLTLIAKLLSDERANGVTKPDPHLR